MKILLSALTGLGNFVLKTPMVQAWKELYPDDDIHLIAGNTYGAEFVLRGSPLITRTHFISVKATRYEKFRFFRQLRHEHFDVVVLPFDAQPNFLIFGSYLARIPLRIRHLHPALLSDKRKAAITLFCAKNTRWVPVWAGRHETELNMDLLRAYHQKPIATKFPSIVNFVRNPEVLQRFGLQSKPYILLQPGAANGQYMAKVWPPFRFAALIQQLAAHFPQYAIVLAGDSGDYQKNIDPLLKLLPEPIRSLVINTAGETNIPELVNLIDHAALLICHDSGIMHLADALNKPLIALFGPTDYTRTRPLKPNSTVLFAQGEYDNAMYNFARSEADLEKMDIGHRAMESLSVEEVMNEVKNKLGID